MSDLEGGGIRRWAVSLSLAVVPVLLCLLFVETAFRVRAYIIDTKHFRDKLTLHEVLMGQRELMDEGNATYGQLIRLTGNDRIIFELKPNLSATFEGVLVRTSDEGFRDRDYPVEKGAGTVRVIGIGDSIMFGQGVPQGEDYLSVLERTLNSNHPERDWEVINTGAPDYNTTMEVETLKVKGMKYAPDVVLIGFCPNDIASIPDWVLERDDYFTLKKSFFVEYLEYLRDPYRTTFSKIPYRYRNIIGGEAFLRALGELERMGREHGFKVLFVVFTHAKGEIDNKAVQTALDMGITVIDVEFALKYYMKRKGIRDYMDSELSVPDGHPSSVAHGIAADIIYEYFREHLVPGFTAQKQR